VKVVAVLSALAVAVTASAVAATSPRSEKLELRAADVSLARRTVLRQSDLGPAWQRMPSLGPWQSATCPSFRPDLSAYTITGRAASGFLYGSPTREQIVSAVEVFATRGQAAGDFTAGAKPALARCLAYQTRRAFRSYPPGVEGRVLSSRMVASPGLGERSAAYALTARVTGNGTSFSLFMDVVVVQRGRSIAVLGFSGVGRRPSSQRSRTLTVVSRMR
jgi:hypothetical protein